MFVFFVTAEQGAWDRPTYSLEAGRFLEHTDDEVKSKFSALDDVTEELLLQMPALFAYEATPWQGAAHVGSLKTIRRRGSHIQFSYVFDPAVAPIPPERLVDVLAHLGISDKYEMTRTHVAIKQGDLFGTLRDAELLDDVKHPVPTGRALSPSPATAPAAVPPPTKKVFLVHGRDAGAKHEVARYLEHLGLEVIILHERPNGGRTLISKFQDESADIGFAVVLMTADDVGGLSGARKKTRPRARQNVVFELGYFIGKLGSERVCALVGEGIERPSDYEGVVFEELDARGAWKMALARELQEAGIPINANHIIGPRRGT